MTPQLLAALIALIGNISVGGFFVFMGHQHAKERRFLVNAALSGNTYEFMARQSASTDRPTAPEDPEPTQYPEGI